MKRLILCAALALTAIAVQANPTVENNGILTNKEGRTLYTFTKDAPGRSNCSDGCAAAWPPFLVANPALAGGDFTIVTRDDGAAQWAYKGMPLYFYAADMRAGDANGEGQGGVWFTVKTRARAGKARADRDGYSFADSYRY
jgi:predicted lipoprotein with Yx(FWY)xxD motif